MSEVRAQAIDYLLLGTLTRDAVMTDPAPTLRDGARDDFVLGGTAAFSAAMAHALGLRVGLVARFGTDVDVSALAGVAVQRLESAVTTTFQNRYSAGGREQHLHVRAESIASDDVPAAWRGAPIVHLGPLAQDLDARAAGAFPNARVGVTPQGWLRRWDARGRVTPCDWEQPDAVLAHAAAIVLSIEDVGGDLRRIEAWAERTAVLVVTEAERGATVFHAGVRRSFAAPAVSISDPTGAGDLFAAAYFAAYHASGDALAATERCVWLTSMLLARRDARFPSRALVESLLRDQRG
jgi:sugar/nucleoside kinase (ribokinase family)